MQLIFVIISILGLTYFLFKKRTFDFFSIAYFSSIAYFLPGFFGFIRNFPLRYPTMIVDKTYLVMILVLTSILVSSLIYDINSRKSKKNKKLNFSIKRTDRILEIAAIIAIVSALLVLATAGSSIHSLDKTEAVSSLNRFSILMKFSASYGLVLAYLNKNKKYIMVFFLVLLFDVYIGYRSDFAIAIITIITISLYGKGPQRLLVSNFKKAALGGGLAFFFFISKPIFQAIKRLDFTYLKTNLTSIDWYFMKITTSEPFTTQSILNEVLIKDFRVGMEHLGTLIYLVIIGGSSLGANPVTFYDLFHEALFHSTGMASNIWAEMYSSGGWILLLFFVILFNLVIYIGNRLLNVKDHNIKSFVALNLTFWAFYIHRNDFFSQLVRHRRILFIFIVLTGLSILLSKKARQKEDYNGEKKNYIDDKNIG